MNTKLEKKFVRSPAEQGEGNVTFCKTFAAKAGEKVTVRATAMGVFQVFLNGKKLGDDVLAPGVTSYLHRLQAMTYVGVAKEKNVIEICVGQGWAVGYYGYGTTHHNFADHVSVAASVSVGDKTFCTDKTWEVFTSKVTFSDIYNGETVDLTYRPKKLGAAVPEACPTEKIVDACGAPIKEQEILSPVSLIVTPKGEKVIDFGQNLTGYVSVTVEGKKGDRVVLEHGEVLDADGNFYNANYRKARNVLTFVLDGKKDFFKPGYSFQGFRYVRVNEFPGEVDLSAFRAIVVHSEMKRLGDFRCGNEKVNQLYRNVIWGQKGNYLDIPTDCPQRDERLGWSGDAQVFCRAAAMNFDVGKFFEKWLGDWRLEQSENGAVWSICPVVAKCGRREATGWGDVVTIAPYTLYREYGDKKYLADNFSMMCRWVDFMHGAGSEEFLWLGGHHYGDWLAMDGNEDSYKGLTSDDLLASAYFAYSCSLVVKAGKALGKDVSSYEKLYENVVRRFREYFLLPDGMPKHTVTATDPKATASTQCMLTSRCDTQTALVIMLHFGLCPEERRKDYADLLLEKIADFDGRMTTGFLGTPYIMHALTAIGRPDKAYDLLFEERNPSWLYSVTHGATTVWEHWNGIKEDGSFWSTDMNSFNHYAYGAVMDWVYSTACGISQTDDSVGYSHLLLRPIPDKRLGSAEASLETPHGKVTASWYYRDGIVTYTFTVPAGVPAEIVLPDGTRDSVVGGTHRYATGE